MATASTVNQARDIALEVASYRPDYSNRRKEIIAELHAERLWVRTRNFAVGILAAKAFGCSHMVIRQADRYIAPRDKVSTLTYQTLAMTAYAGTQLYPEIDKVMDNCCLGAELKFVHGLEHHRLNKYSHPCHEAALILHDVDDEPFAYQKAVGYPYAYVWRDSLMQTRAGVRWLPAGAIIRPIYDRNNPKASPPQERFAGAGLVGVTGCLADEVEFKRFSLQVMPESIRRAGLLDASVTEAYGDLRHHAKEATRMSNADFAGYIDELAKYTKNYCIT